MHLLDLFSPPISVVILTVPIFHIVSFSLFLSSPSANKVCLLISSFTRFSLSSCLPEWHPLISLLRFHIWYQKWSHCETLKLLHLFTEDTSDFFFSSDIDECVIDNDGCEQICINEPGTSRCSCGDGYHLNYTKCIGNVFIYDYLYYDVWKELMKFMLLIFISISETENHLVQ